MHWNVFKKKSLFLPGIALPISLLSLLSLFSLLSLWPSPIQAGFNYLHRSPQALLMGDAFTAVADDEYTLFYNPAALARHNGVSITFANPRLDVYNAYRDRDKFKNFPSDSQEIAERVLGIPLHLQLSITPGIKLYHFALSHFVNSSTNMVLRNLIHPNLEIDHRFDRGFVAGFAFILGGDEDSFIEFNSEDLSRPVLVPSSGHQTSIGVGIKTIDRQALRGNFDFFSAEILDIIDDVNNYKDIRSALGHSQGSGFGVDLGVEQVFFLSEDTQLNMGVSLLDAFDTRFKRKSGNQALPVQKMNLNAGGALIKRGGLFQYKLAVDFHPILEKLSFKKKIHLGVKLGIPFLDLYGGWSGGDFSFGVGLKLFFFEILAGVYSIPFAPEFEGFEKKQITFSINILDLKF